MLSNIPQIKLAIVKAIESSGNIQFFCRAYRTDLPKDISPIERLSSGLDISCHQTKHYDINECMSRAWFDMSFSARFYGIKMSDVKLQNFTESEKKFIVKQMSINS